MSQIDAEAPVLQQPLRDVKKIKPLKAYAIIVGFTVVVFVLGVMIGKLFFWNTYNKTSLADRTILVNQEKLKKNPKDPKVLTDLGWGYFKKGDYNQALNFYKQALDQNKDYYPAHLNLGIAFTEAKKYDLAIESLKTAISLSPKSPSAHLNLGLVYNLAGKYQEAIDELSLVDKANPGNVEVIYQLGLAYEKLKKYDNAAYQYQAALQFDPKYTLAQEAIDRTKDKITKK